MNTDQLLLTAGAFATATSSAEDGSNLLVRGAPVAVILLVIWLAVYLIRRKKR
jgi:hypothetical protein